MTAKHTASTNTPAEISAGSRQDTSTRADHDAQLRRRARFWLIIFLILNLTDLLTTIVAIRLGGSEANVLPSLMERYYGIPGLIVIKTAAVAVVCANLAFMWRPARTPAGTRASRKLVWRQLQVFSCTLLLLTAGNCYAIFLQLAHR